VTDDDGPTMHPHVAESMEKHEQLRAEELERLTELHKRIERGVDEGLIDYGAGMEMLLNISKARMALFGVGAYPGAW
jgi:hypothetical protein